MSDWAETDRVSENAFALRKTKPETSRRRFFVVENFVRIVPQIEFLWLRPAKRRFDGGSRPAQTSAQVVRPKPSGRGKRIQPSQAIEGWSIGAMGANTLLLRFRPADPLTQRVDLGCPNIA